jgi:hypothetical protein
MKALFLLLFCGFSPFLYAQNSLGSLNANAVSGNAYSHTIGDIYIESAATSPSNSGMMGVFSGIRAQLVQTEAATNMETTMYFYPNPVENVLNLGIKNQENTALEATVYDMTGRVMLSQKIQNGQIDMSELVAGAYLVQIMHETEELSFKILKK